MARRFTATYLLLAAVLLARLAADGASAFRLGLSGPFTPEHANAEARLSIGQPLELATATAADLQLVPGIAHPLAEELVEQRERIRKCASQLPGDRRFEALLLVHGIGWKTANKLKAYIAP